MARRNQPYLPLYVQDFMTDEKLAECSAAATGVYIRLMCLMHKSEYYGKILLKQKYKQNDKQILNFASMVAKNLPYTENTILSCLQELVDEQVLHIEGDFLVQKRMVKDAEISDRRANAGQNGGKKTQEKRGDFAKANLQANAKAKSEANSENEIEIEYKDIKEREYERKPSKGEKAVSFSEDKKFAIFQNGYKQELGHFQLLELEVEFLKPADVLFGSKY